MTHRAHRTDSTPSRGVRAARLGILLTVSVVTTAVGAAILEELPGSIDRSDFQSLADASALAGGRAFLERTGAEAPIVAEEQALRYALERAPEVRALSPSQVEVEVDGPSKKIRVSIRPHDLAMKLQSLFGLRPDAGAVTAVASANPLRLDCEADEVERDSCEPPIYALRLIE